MSQIQKELLIEVVLPFIGGIYLGYWWLDQYYIKELIG